MPATTPGPSPIEAELPATTASRVRALAITGGFRLAAGTALLSVAAGRTYIGSVDLGFILLPMVGYVALAAAMFACRRHLVAQRISLLMPFLDVALAFIVHHHGMVTFSPFVASWAISSLGVYTIIVAIVGLSMSLHMVVVVTVLSVLAEWFLLHIPGSTLSPTGSMFHSAAVATFTLALVAIATSAVPRITETALRQEHLAGVARESLAQVQEQHRRLGLLQREKDALLEIIVHDMRSPVGAAMLSLEYLSMELKKLPKQAPLLEATDDALSTLNNLSAMIGQILDAAKLEDGRITLRLDLTELRPMLEAAQRELVVRAASRFVAVELQAPDGLVASVDRRLFRRALDTLLTYVLRRTPEGGRICLVMSRGEERLQISVHSTAPAVAAGERERIFDKFPFVEGKPLQVSGWALGLYFCRLVASAHQGSIALEDVPGWTTSFVIRLPAVA
jgi:signal transduction histidine kinase